MKIYILPLITLACPEGGTGGGGSCPEDVPDTVKQPNKKTQFSCPQIVTFATPIALLLGMHISPQKALIMFGEEICQDVLVDETYDVLHSNNIHIRSNLCNS